ncbi:Golgi-associated PDZ and coiled-coil motif-containing protein-like [Orbicella faveolata]|uniref:Golgi-associated PDZ and coiled-coil motif-containing protein-like n=1 Tax=Orbicella faveolata TaxID=48498 RepID=UPI0009E50FF3|nr:Golgi-associated PDZ and coiled-coil motif-containing protein-like [Orbicella faveolata]
MAVAVSMFRWLDLLEKEFDKTFVDLDILLGEIDPDQSEITYDGRQKMTQLSSTFAQLVHKAQTIFQGNAKLEAELVALRHDLVEEKAAKQVLEKEVNNLLLQLHAVQLQLHSNAGMPLDSENIKNKLENEMTRYKNNAMKEARMDCQVKQLEKENTALRNHVFSLQGEVYGARLAAKYLDKELAGRIQQIQLLGRDMRGSEHDQLWNQIEAEIHLHRHKTVIRACRGRKDPNNKTPAPPPPPPAQAEATVGEEEDAESKARKRRGIGEPRTVVIHKDKTEGLGISITGGKEHGVPIIVSEIHEGLPVGRSGGLYVGDAILAVNGIDLQEAKHSEAVKVLSNVHGEITLEVLYVAPDDSSDDEDTWEEDEGQRYSMLGRVEDPASELSNGDVYMTNSKRDSTRNQASSQNDDQRSPPSSPRAAPYLHTHPGVAQPVSVSPESAKKYRNPATIPETFSTTVDSRGSHSDLSSRSNSQSSLSLASTLSPHQSGGMNVGRLEPLIQAPSDGVDTSSELFSATT